MNEIVADLLARLDVNQLEEFEERAGRIEFEQADVQRALAEALAMLCILRRHPEVLNRFKPLT